MPRKILVCDDEPAIVRLLHVNLDRHGYDVLTTGRGADCLALAAAEHPDLILLDVMMPGTDGFTVLDSLKQCPEVRDIPVIMLTARAQDADVLRGWRGGADCYWPKPFLPEELMAYIHRLFTWQDACAVEPRYRLDRQELRPTPVFSAA